MPSKPFGVGARVYVDGGDAQWTGETLVGATPRVAVRESVPGHKRTLRIPGLRGAKTWSQGVTMHRALALGFGAALSRVPE